MIQPVTYLTTPKYYNQVKFTSKKEAAGPLQPETKKKLAIGGAVAAGLALFGGLITKLRKPSPDKQMAKQVQKLIKNLKPQDEGLAKDIYPILITHSKKLGITENDFNYILRGMNNRNREFMASAGLNIISDNIEKIRKCITSPLDFSPKEVVLELVESLTAENKPVFEKIIQIPEKLKIEDPIDISTFLRSIKAENLEYAFDELLPLLNKYEKPLDLRTADHYAELLGRFNKKTQHLIKEVAESKKLDNKNINYNYRYRYNILTKVNNENHKFVTPIIEAAPCNKDDLTNLMNIMKYLKIFNNSSVNNENYKCVTPIIEANSGNEEDIKKCLKIFNNSNAYCIKPILTNLENLKNLELTYSTDIKAGIPDAIKMLKDEEDANIFGMVMKDPELYNICALSDLKWSYLKDLKGKDLKFLEEVIEPKIRQYKELYELRYPDHISEIMNNMTPEIASSFDEIAPYAEKYGSKVNYQGLLHALTNDNVKNLKKLLDNIHKTDLWEDRGCFSDYKPYLDGIKDIL